MAACDVKMIYQNGSVAAYGGGHQTNKIIGAWRRRRNGDNIRRVNMSAWRVQMAAMTNGLA